MALGTIRGAAVRLAEARDRVGICEGIETGLSVMQLYSLPIWCSLGSNGDKMELPTSVRHIIVFGDNGEPGEKIAYRTAEAAIKSGRNVEIVFPALAFSDFNDALVASNNARRRTAA
jgi:hypothetical protein